MSLRELKPGESAIVSKVEGSGPIRQRLLDMGIMPRVRIELERVSPVGDPIWIKFDGTHVSLRLREAESIVLAEPELDRSKIEPTTPSAKRMGPPPASFTANDPAA